MEHALLLTSESVMDLIALCSRVKDGDAEDAKGSLADAGFVECQDQLSEPNYSAKYRKAVLTKVVSEVLQIIPEAENEAILERAHDHIDDEQLFEERPASSTGVSVKHKSGVVGSFRHYGPSLLDQHPSTRGCGAAVDCFFNWYGDGDIEAVSEAMAAGNWSGSLRQIGDTTKRIDFKDTSFGTVSGYLSVFAPSEKVADIVGGHQTLTSIYVSAQRQAAAA